MKRYTKRRPLARASPLHKPQHTDHDGWKHAARRDAPTRARQRALLRRVASTEQNNPAILATEEAVEHRDRLPLEQHSALSLPSADRRTNGPASS